MVRWRNLRRDSVGIQRYFVVVGSGNFLGVAEKRSPRLRGNAQFPSHRHHLQRAVVADPRRGLVAHCKSLNAWRVIPVKPSRRITFRDRCPKIESERERNGGKCVSA